MATSNTTNSIGMSEAGQATQEARWFVLVQPVQASSEWQELLTELEPLTGGKGDGVPHVTVVHGRGTAAIEDVAAAVESLRGELVPVRAEGEPVFWHGPQMHFQWTMAQPVAKDEDLQPWYERICSGMHGLGLVKEWSWESWKPYVTVLRGGEGRPFPDTAARQRALQVLHARVSAVDFTIEQVWASRLHAGQFHRVASLRVGKRV
ncbi:MAG TPA: hypothetical protein VGW38_26650 [Chloroflexota bacterium]|nr:hypothetical protein [Chloroflexota bacterium]